MKCDKCGETVYVVTLDSKHRKVCDECLSPSGPYKIDGDKCKKVIDEMYNKIKV